jgi:GxxExxY protein
VVTQRLDMVIDGKIVLELKAASELNDLFKQQTLSYLRATGLKLGILINFGAARVESVRITNRPIPTLLFVPFVVSGFYSCHSF